MLYLPLIGDNKNKQNDDNRRSQYQINITLFKRYVQRIINLIPLTYSGKLNDEYRMYHLQFYAEAIDSGYSLLIQY